MKNKKNTLIRVSAIISVLAIILSAWFMVNFDIVKVDGTSMAPTLEDNQYMVVKSVDYTKEEASYGDMIIIVVEGEQKVKRVLGKAGDTIQFVDDVLIFNGEARPDVILPKDYDEMGNEEGKVVTVEEGQYYVLGDNIGASVDSRILGTFGADEMVGKVVWH